MAAKFFTGLPLDGPDPECVRGFGEQALADGDGSLARPKPSVDRSHRTSPPRPRAVPLTLQLRRPAAPPISACNADPVAEYAAQLAAQPQKEK
jgi:hypothetical protein